MVEIYVYIIFFSQIVNVVTEILSAKECCSSANMTLSWFLPPVYAVRTF